MEIQDWLGKENQLGIDIWKKKYQHGNETFDEWLDRISGGNRDIRQLIVDKKFLFGGRILSNRGLQKNGIKSSMSNCFIPGSKVLTSEGFKNIEDVKVGDMVLSDDGEFHNVNAVMQRDYEGDLYEIDSPNLISPIRCTPNHKFLTNHGWKRADRILACSPQIHSSDKIKMAIPNNLKTDNENEFSEISSINIVENYTGKVYNLSVDETHTYNVNGAIVHNCYVISAPSDDIESIFECAKKLARTYSYGG